MNNEVRGGASPIVDLDRADERRSGQNDRRLPLEAVPVPRADKTGCMVRNNVEAPKVSYVEIVDEGDAAAVVDSAPAADQHRIFH